MEQLTHCSLSHRHCPISQRPPSPCGTSARTREQPHYHFRQRHDCFSVLCFYTPSLAEDCCKASAQSTSEVPPALYPNSVRLSSPRRVKHSHHQPFLDCTMSLGFLLTGHHSPYPLTFSQAPALSTCACICSGDTLPPVGFPPKTPFPLRTSLSLLPPCPAGEGESVKETK